MTNTIIKVSMENCPPQTARTLAQTIEKALAGLQIEGTVELVLPEPSLENPYAESSLDADLSRFNHSP